MQQQAKLFGVNRGTYDEIYEDAAVETEEEPEQEAESEEESGEEVRPVAKTQTVFVDSSPGTLSILWSYLKDTLAKLSPLYWWGIADQDTHVLMAGSIATLSAELYAFSKALPYALVRILIILINIQFFF